MTPLRAALFAGLVFVTGSTAPAREAKTHVDKSKLVGTWTLVKTTSKKAPTDSYRLTLTLAKDGELNATLEFGGRSQTISGTYTVAGNRMTTALKGRGGKQKETVTIAELTDKRLVTTEDEGGTKVTTEFEK